jgi:dihydrofolate reductase
MNPDMRDLVITENVTLDGVMAPMDGWFDPTAADDGVRAATTAHREAADALVLGRVTYEEFAGFWPHQVDDRTGISDYLNQVDKYVVSAGLNRADWANTTILRGPIEPELAALKQAAGRDIVVTGSAGLVRSLLPSGLVDLYRLFIYPVVQGHGRRLFPDGFAQKLRLADAQTFESGVVLLEYRPRQ